MAFWRVAVNESDRWATGSVEMGPVELLPDDVSLDLLLDGESWHQLSATRGTLLKEAHELLPPIEGQEVWAAGVTYIESRYAREDESSRPDIYEAVYNSARPEIFLKAAPNTAVGSGAAVGIRLDSPWNVPEPELALAVDAHARIVAYTIGNDVSSRTIEGENPLFLPQAKIYDASCSLGPCLVPVEEAPPLDDMTVDVVINRDYSSLWEGSFSVGMLKRKPEELVDYLFMARTFDRGVILLTGTGVVPPPDVTLQQGDSVIIRITGLGELKNTVKVVGRTWPAVKSASHHASNELQS